MRSVLSIIQRLLGPSPLVLGEFFIRDLQRGMWRIECQIQKKRIFRVGPDPVDRGISDSIRSVFIAGIVQIVVRIG